MCLDTGICAEGIITMVEGTLVEINEENCKNITKLGTKKSNLQYKTLLKSTA